MSRIIIICTLATILTGAAQAFDGTPSPANVMPSFESAPLDLPPGLLAQANPGATTSLRDQLVGVWELVSCEGINVSNTVTCVNVHGIQILDASGRYVTLSIPKDRPKFTNPNQARRSQPAEEYKAAAMGIVANFGTWSVNEGDNTIVLHFDGALFPNVEGQDVKFPFSLSGDELKTTTLIDHDVWRRIRK